MGVIDKVLEGFGPVKRLVPAGVKRAARKSLLEQALRRAVRRVAALPEGAPGYMIAGSSITIASQFPDVGPRLNSRGFR